MHMKALLRRLKKPRHPDHFDANSGQALVLIGIAALGLFAIMGLAIDGGRLLFLRREAQNAADAAAIAAARAMCTGRDPEPYALAAADANRFDNNGVDNWVTVNTPPQNANFTIPDECLGCYVEVTVKGEIPPSFIGLVYDGELAANGHAIGTCNPDILASSDTAPEIRAAWGMYECSPNAVTITGSNIYIEGGLHSNGSMKVMPSQGGGTVKGATSVVTPYNASQPVHGQQKITWSAGEGGGSGDTGSTSTGTCLASCFNLSLPGDEGVETIPADGSPYVTTPKASYPVDFTIDQFQPGGKYHAAASAKGEYHAFSCSGDFWTWIVNNHMSGGVIDDGIYYANCDIDIKKNQGANNVTGNITIVTTGQLHVHGRNQQWQPYVFNDAGHGLLMFSNANEGCTGKGAVKFSGSQNTWNGIIFSPYGTIKMSASTNDSTAGCLIGYSVEISGARNRIICDTSASTADPQPALWLSE